MVRIYTHVRYTYKWLVRASVRPQILACGVQALGAYYLRQPPLYYGHSISSNCTVSAQIYLFKAATAYSSQKTLTPM